MFISTQLYNREMNRFPITYQNPRAHEATEVSIIPIVLTLVNLFMV